MFMRAFLAYFRRFFYTRLFHFKQLGQRGCWRADYFFAWLKMIKNFPSHFRFKFAAVLLFLIQPWTHQRSFKGQKLCFVWIRKFVIGFSVLLFSWSALSKEELVCSRIYPIQYSYIAKHISYFSLSKTLEKRTVEQLIKSMDGNKLYFITSDVKQIKRWFSNIFQDLKEADCKALVQLYNLFYQRVKERSLFARSRISRKDFKFNQDTALLLSADDRDFFKTKQEQDQFHSSYIQYEIASIMTVENDLEKAKKHLMGIYDRKEKTIYGWNPSPSQARLEECRELDKKNKQVKTCKSEKWYAVYLDSFSKALDPHSSYLSQYELDDFEINMKLSLEGVGASLSSRYGYTTVERLLPGGAAKRSGKIKKKDKIIAIGQAQDKMVNIFGWNLRDVVEMVRGRKGTQVYLQLLRNLKNGIQKKIIVRLIRDKIDLTENASSIVYAQKTTKDGRKYSIGVIRVPSFYGGGAGSLNNRSVSRDIERLIQSAGNKVSALVLDLTGNGGGVLTEAVQTAGLFIKQGNIVRQMTKTFSGRSVYHTLADEDGKVSYTGPLVVLVDRSSASASEIVAGALKDYDRAVVVGGDHTFGKGSIQSVENIEDGLGATKTTVGLFYIPGGKSTQKNGVFSDIPFPSVMTVDSFGEKTLDYVLSGRHTTSFLTKQRNISWNRVTDSLLKKLKIRSRLRVKKSDKFKDVQKDLAELKKKLKNKKPTQISTFLTDAKKQNEEEKELEDDLDLDPEDPRFKKEVFGRADITEAVNVAWDMVILSPDFNSFVKTN